MSLIRAINNFRGHWIFEYFGWPIIVKQCGGDSNVDLVRRHLFSFSATRTCHLSTVIVRTLVLSATERIFDEIKIGNPNTASAKYYRPNQVLN